jgi:hypothetical protein
MQVDNMSLHWTVSALFSFLIISFRYGFNLTGRFPDILPGTLNVMQLRVGLPDTEAQCQLIIHAGMCQVEISTLVQPLKQFLVKRIAAPVTKANQIQRRWYRKFEATVLLNPFCKFLGYFNMPADVVPKALNPIVPYNKPKFQGTKTAAQGDLPIPVIDYRTGFGRFIAQILGQYA